MNFSGSARTFFGIWIVNVLLSALTLGIYSAWAKVRTRQYFYQNTTVGDRRFDYHATGGQIFKGRLIVVLGLILLQIPLINIVLLLALIVMVPWLLNRSIAFNARMTSFSGVRFGFSGTYWGAFKSYLLYPILSVFTAYTTLPIVIRAQHRYYVNGHRLGQAGFAFNSPLKPFYTAFGIAIGWAVFAVLVLGAIGFVTGALAPLFDPYGMQPMFVPVAFLWVAFIVAFLPAGFIYSALIRNQVYASTQLDGAHQFRSTVRPFVLMTLAVSNALAIICSLGFATPWAHIRMARYLADNTIILAAGTMDEFVDTQEGAGSAIGDAYTDIEGIDLGVAI
ncbi:YjgN family protein [Thioclava sp. SK-1]|uniref:YjgN family protein n=1 Tax=Thioclava sp. SK-1 TaxID=1889770 RepID=UPI002101B4F4|nr:YjgN family protein [Thioclava sp. SK-1]